MNRRLKLKKSRLSAFKIRNRYDKIFFDFANAVSMAANDLKKQMLDIWQPIIGK